jgi:hypothetical protein
MESRRKDFFIEPVDISTGYGHTSRHDVHEATSPTEMLAAQKPLSLVACARSSARSSRRSSQGSSLSLLVAEGVGPLAAMPGK